MTGIVAVAGLLLAAWPVQEGRRGETAVIRSARDSTLEVNLSVDSTLVVEGALGQTVIRVGGGGLEFISSACPHRVCVERGRVTRSGEYVVCVPNGVSARIKGDSDFDAIVP
jgi:hypothetical protein